MPPKKTSISRHAKGSSQKARRRSVSPPEAVLSLDFNKTTTVEQVQTSIISMLGVMTEDPTLQRKILQATMDQLPLSTSMEEDTGTVTAATAAAEQQTATLPTVVETPPIPINATPNDTLSYNPMAFKHKLQGGALVERKPGAMRQAKSYYVEKFTSAYKSVPTEEQKLLTVHSWLTKNRAVPAVAEALRSVVYGSEGIDIIQNLREIYSLADSTNKKRLADSVGFRRTFLMALAPTIGDPTKRAIRQLGKLLGVKSRTFQSQFKRAVQARKSLMLSHNPKEPILQVYTRKLQGRVTPDILVQLEHWLKNECDEIVASPNARDSVMCTDPETGLQERKPKYYYLSSVREVHNEMLKSFPGAKNASGKVLISDTMLRMNLPRWLSRMTDSHKEMCGCEPCIIVKQFLRTVVAWIRNFTTSHNEEDPDAIEEMRTFFLKLSTITGSYIPRYEHPRQLVALMTCAPPAEHEGLFRMKCCLGRCKNCPNLDVPTIMESEDDMIAYQNYKYHSYCTLHKSLTGAPTKCPVCEEAEEGEPKGKLLRKKHLTRNKSTIGHYMNEVFIPQFEAYRYHLLYIILLGKNYCVKWRKEAYLQIPGACLIQRDFADRLIAAFTDQIQSTHFGESASMSMEGNTCRWAPDQFHYHSFLADNSDQDSRTVYVNTVTLIRFLKKEYGLLPAGSWFFELMDGCAKQYRSGTALYLLTVVSVLFRLHFDRMIQAPHHGKGDCDSQGGIDKNYLRRYFRRTIVPEENSTKKGVEAHTVGEDGVRESIAERLATILRDPSRDEGSKGDVKHEKREASAKIQKRHYHVIHNGKSDTDSNVELPIQHTKFKANGFPASRKGKEKYNGLMAHYHFHADPNMGVGKIAARRIPCLCPPCFAQLQTPWQDNIPPEAQEKFISAPNCHLKAILDDCNEWLIITLTEGEAADEEEIKTLHENILDEHEAEMGDLIVAGDFAAVETSADEGYYIVKWMDDPAPVEDYDAEDDLAEVEGCARDKLQEGTMVCAGMYYETPGRARRWYVPPKKEEHFLFRVRYVVATGLTMEEASDAVKFPVAQVKRRDRETVLAMGPVRMAQASLDIIVAAIAMRDKLNYEEERVIELGGDDSDSEEGASDSDEEDLD